MTREEELRKAVDDNPILYGLVKHMLHQEELLEDLLTYPKYRTDPNHPGRIKITDAQRLYKETYTEYLNTIRTIERATATDETEAESPLRSWIKKKNIE